LAVAVAVAVAVAATTVGGTRVDVAVALAVAVGVALAVALGVLVAVAAANAALGIPPSTAVAISTANSHARISMCKSGFASCRAGVFIEKDSSRPRGAGASAMVTGARRQLPLGAKTQSSLVKSTHSPQEPVCAQ
jgi:hypothetical protein